MRDIETDFTERGEEMEDSDNMSGGEYEEKYENDDDGDNAENGEGLEKKEEEGEDRNDEGSANLWCTICCSTYIYGKKRVKLFILIARCSHTCI